MAAPAWLCISCERSYATRLCLCTDPSPLLCDPCLQSHTAKNTALIHTNLPVAAYGHHRNPGYLPRLDSRIRASLEVERKVTETVEEIDRCRDTLDGEIANIVDHLQQFKDQTRARLEQLKDSLLEALIAVKESVYEDEPQLQSDLARDMRERWHTPDATFKYFTYSVNRTVVTDAVTASLLSVELHAFPQAALYACVVKGNEAKFVDVKTGRVDRFEAREAFSEGTVFCPVGEDWVAGVGGYPATPSAFLMRASTHELKPIAPMATPRNIAGVVSFDGFLYVFGGYREKTPLTSCEKHCLATNVWSWLPDMAFPRIMFSPCECKRRIYLVDMSQTHRKIEVFSVDTGTYAVFPVDLPAVRQYSVAVVVDGELVVFGTGKKVCRLRLTGEASFRVGEFNDQGNKAATVFHPLVVGRKVFFSSYGSSALLEFDLDRHLLSVSPLQ